MRVFRRQVYQLYRGTAHHDESVPHQSGRDERRKNGILEKPRLAYLERYAGNGHKDGRPSDRARHHGILRRLLQWFRGLHTPTA